MQQSEEKETLVYSELTLTDHSRVWDTSIEENVQSFKLILNHVDIGYYWGKEDHPAGYMIQLYSDTKVTPVFTLRLVTDFSFSGYMSFYTNVKNGARSSYADKLILTFKKESINNNQITGTISFEDESNTDWSGSYSFTYKGTKINRIRVTVSTDDAGSGSCGVRQLDFYSIS